MRRSLTRQKPLLTLVTLGASGHGKSTLARALAAKAALLSAPIVRKPLHAKNLPAFSAPECSFETHSRRYRLRDGAGREGVLCGLLYGPTPPDAALLVVSAARGATDALAEQLSLLDRLGVSSLVAFLNQSDEVNDPDLLDLVEREVRDFLVERGYPGDEIAVIRGDAKGALSGTREGAASIERLLAAMDEHLHPRPPSPRAEDFLLLIQERFARPGQDLIAAGRVLRGEVRVGEALDLVSADAILPTRLVGLDVATNSGGSREDSIASIGVLRERRERAVAGQLIGCRLVNVTREALQEGYALARADSLTLYQKARALVWLSESPRAQSSPGHLRFRVRGEPGGFRPLFPVGKETRLPPGSLQSLLIPPTGLAHLETPAYIDLFALPNLDTPVGAGVITALLEPVARCH